MNCGTRSWIHLPLKSEKVIEYSQTSASETRTPLATTNLKGIRPLQTPTRVDNSASHGATVICLNECIFLTFPGSETSFLGALAVVLITPDVRFSSPDGPEPVGWVSPFGEVHD